jgi:hypothetical protein
LLLNAHVDELIERYIENYQSLKSPASACPGGFCVILALGDTAVWADEIVLKNGGHITGAIRSVDGGKVSFDSMSAGTIGFGRRHI